MNHKSRPWTPQEEEYLREQAGSGVEVLNLSAALERNMGAVIAKMCELGLKVPHRGLPRK